MLLGAFRIARGHPNPEFFYYPSMLFNMIGVATWAVSKFYAPHGVTLISPVTYITDPTPYYLIGRAVVAACGVASVYLVYRLGKEAFSRPVGLLAALFLAVEPLHVRYSHVAVTDVPATMFGLLALAAVPAGVAPPRAPAPCCSAPWPPVLPPAPSTTSACSSCPARSPAGTCIATSSPLTG